MIKAIFFDFEGVITNLPMMLHKEFYGRIKSEISFSDFDARYHLAKVGKTKYADLMKGFMHHEAEILSMVKLRAGAKETLEYFNSKKVPLFIASNHVDWLSEKEVEILRVEKYFKKRFFSNEMGLAKPDEKFFLEILAQSGLDLKKSEMIFIDDAKRNLVVAKKLGFVTIYLPNGIAGDKRNTIDFKADYEINELTELIGVFESLNK